MHTLEAQKTTVLVATTSKGPCVVLLGFSPKGDN